MFASTLSIASLSLLLNSALANAQVTAAAQLAPRQTGSDPAFVGYISENGGYSDARSCDYPQTVSTSGAYVQCCPATGSCPFYTACSSNVLMAAGTSVPCDVNAALTCNTGIVKTTAGANGGASYLACWQTSLGSNPFTFVQNIGSATSSGSSGASTTQAAASGNTARSSSTASRTSSAASSASSAASAASGSASSAASSAASTAASATHNVGNIVAGDLGLSGAVGGVVGLLVQALL